MAVVMDWITLLGGVLGFAEQSSYKSVSGDPLATTAFGLEMP
jgi:hypothetical protein